jgi:hypothetical protein
LKSVCEEAICDDIDIGNAVHSLILGHLHEAKNLKATALEYVSTNLVNKFFFCWIFVDSCYISVICKFSLWICTFLVNLSKTEEHLRITVFV